MHIKTTVYKCSVINVTGELSQVILLVTDVWQQHRLQDELAARLNWLLCQLLVSKQQGCLQCKIT